MLVLLSFALVLVATVLLVLGLLNDGGLTLIYISIACSAAAAVVLVVAVRLGKPKDTDAALQPEPLPEPADEPVLAGVAAGGASGARLTEPEPVAGAPAEPAAGEWAAADQDEWAVDDDWVEGDELEFPIADYDDLSSAQILPLLPQLYSDEIAVVEERERLTKARPEILARLAELAGDADGIGDPLADHVDAPGRATDVGTWADDDDDVPFPIEGYDELSVAQIRPLLGQLEDDELAEVRDREAAGQGRATILDAIDRALGTAPAAKAPAKRAASRPSTAKRATAKRAPAKKAATKKAATRKAPAKKAASKKAASKKAPARKAASKKAPAKKAAARKVPAKKTASKKAAAKKAPAKKAAAKKASKRR